MRIVFMGSGAFGVPTLTELLSHHEVAMVVSQPDRPAGRKRRLTPTPIATLAEERGIPLLRPERVNQTDVTDEILSVKADVHVVVAFGQKVGQALIDGPSYGPMATMNLHASLLPQYRGAAPINWAMADGQVETGNTIFSLVEQMDAGPMLAQQRTPIDVRETAGELHDRLALLGSELMLTVLEDLSAGRLVPKVQDDAAATIARKISKRDGQVDWSLSPDRVCRMLHAWTPWPGVKVGWTLNETDGLSDGQTFFVRRIEPCAWPSEVAFDPADPPVFGQMIADGVIATGSNARLDDVVLGSDSGAGDILGAVRLLEVQPLGKRVMSWTDYQRGRSVPLGITLRGA